MPVIVNFTKPIRQTMQDLLFGQIAVLEGGDYPGFIVTRVSMNIHDGYICFTTNNHTAVDRFSGRADYQVRILRSGESFTVTIP